MEAGKLRHRITILRDVEGDPSATGMRAKTYVEFGKVWGEVRTLAGREVERARTISATATHTVRVRYTKDVSETYQLRWGERTLCINAVVDEENRKRELILYCTEERGE